MSTAIESEPDVRVERDGPMASLFLFFPLTCAATDWIEEHIPEDATWFGAGLVVEHRYAEDIALGMLADGLRVV